MADDFINGLGGADGGAAGPQSGGGTAAGTTADILRNQLLSQLIVSLGNVSSALQAAFPQASTALTTTAIGGTHAVPANAVQFLTITVNGTAYKVALFT